MNKEFAALEKIKQFIKPTQAVVKYDNGEQQAFYSHTLGELFPKEFNTIETALSQAQNDKRELEELQKVLDDFGIYNTFNLIDTLKNIRFLETQHIIDSKKFNALKIIKEKKVDCNTLIFYLEKHNETGHIDYAFDSYNDYAKDSDKPQLTKEEFDLLKEVLL